MSSDLLDEQFLLSSRPSAPINGRHPSSEKFHRVLEELAKLHDDKQKDYGTATDPFYNVRASQEWGIQPWVGAMMRASDKLRRLQTAARGGTLKFEGVVDSLNDIAVYAGIARVLYEEDREADRLANGT
jgi:hypothetical protein